MNWYILISFRFNILTLAYQKYIYFPCFPKTGSKLTQLFLNLGIVWRLIV